LDEGADGVRRIFERAGSVLRGNLKAILGRSREPSATAAQMVREIEEALHRTKTRAAQTAADLKRLKRAREGALQQAGRCALQAVEALKAGREDLAAQAVQREQHLQASASAMSKEFGALEARDVDTRSEVLALQARLDEAKLRLRHLRAREGALDSESGVRSLRGSLARPTQLGDVERLEAQMDEWEAELDGRQAAEGDALSGQMHDIEEHLPEIEARLAELRQGLNEQQQ